MSDNVRKILVELDSLLDTRLGTLLSINEEVGLRVLMDGSYHNRTMDNFEKLTDGDISNELFKKVYSERDVGVLKNSRPTKITLLINEITSSVEVQKIESPDVSGIVLFLNVYPYKLSSAEEDAIITAVMVYCAMETEVKLVNLPLSQITPSAIKKNWDGVILYEFDEWFKLHAEELNLTNIPQHLMYVPGLYIKELTRPEDAYIGGENPVTIFAALEMSFIERLNLNILKPSDFSIIKA